MVIVTIIVRSSCGVMAMRTVTEKRARAIFTASRDQFLQRVINFDGSVAIQLLKVRLYRVIIPSILTFFQLNNNNNKFLQESYIRTLIC